MEEPLSLAFTGHMIDLPERKQPRFPPELEPVVGAAMHKRIRSQILGQLQSGIRGYASLARGGDILFHEICRALGLRTIVVLPFEPERFVKTSVEGVASGNWSKRFMDLWEATSPEDRHVLSRPETPEAYAACNAKILALARAHGRVHLIALWDGQDEGGTGGTAHLVSQARRSGDKPIIINPGQL